MTISRYTAGGRVRSTFTSPSRWSPCTIDTPYSARELTDWILQAKLCVYAPDAMLNLRQQGIRTIMDLEGLDQTQIQELVAQVNADDGTMSPHLGPYTVERAQGLRDLEIDRRTVAARGQPYERLDQLTVDLLLGAR